MPPEPIGLVTFDLWDTLLVDDSDEPRRAAAGLVPKPVARRNAVLRAFSQGNDAPSPEILHRAWSVVEAAFRHAWHRDARTWTVRGRVEILQEGLGVSLPESAVEALVRELEEMELHTPPDFVPGAREVLESLAGRWPLAVVSDAIYSPGRVLRQLLQRGRLLAPFTAFAFSDELGASKPDPRVFEAVATEVGVSPSAVVHVGDRESKDVAGPHAVGARAVLFTGVRDRREGEGTRAEAVCEDLRDLPAILDRIHGEH